jgi:DNA-binding TFAR19-related protein (PDSD5 family)
MTTIQIELPDAMARAARDAGLLTPQALERLLNDALKRKQVADSLLSIADRVAATGIEPVSMEEINAEVKAAREERKQRASGH